MKSQPERLGGGRGHGGPTNLDSVSFEVILTVGGELSSDERVEVDDLIFDPGQQALNAA